MAQLSIEEKAKAYDEAIAVINKSETDKYGCIIGIKPSDIFPELRESEDERIRKEITELVMQPTWKTEKEFHRRKELCAWLEKRGENNMGISEATKQKLEDNLNKALEKETPESWNEFLDEQKSIDKVEPKFMVDDWIVNNGHSYLIGYIDYEQRRYLFEIGGYTHEQLNWEYIENVDSKFHLWTIQDAKDGDVLATLDYILIFKEFLKNDGGISYCHYDFGAGNPQFIWSEDKNWYFGKEAIIHPATKEQRDLLFQKMKEAGYTWDAEKKEMKKIEQSSAWSEEDWDYYAAIIAKLEVTQDDALLTDNQMEFLRSLKNRVLPQPKQEWKPSDEQMEVLNWCKPLWNEPKTKAVLESLIEDLKKLRGV